MAFEMLVIIIIVVHFVQKQSLNHRHEVNKKSSKSTYHNTCEDATANVTVNITFR